MTPTQARAAFGAFLLLSSAIVANALFMQNSPEAVALAKEKAARVAAQAELRRAQSLSVDGVDQKRARRRLEWRGGGKAGRVATSGRPSSAKPDSQFDPSRSAVGELPKSAQKKLSKLDERATTVRAVQRELSARGYQPGHNDGVPGLVTRAAVMAFEYDNNLSITGEPSEGLLRRIVLGASYNSDTGRGKLATGANSQAAHVTRTVQQSLLGMGYQPGSPDGVVGADTSRAIREFEMDHGLTPTGRVSGHLVAQLARLAGRGRLASKRR